MLKFIAISTVKTLLTILIVSFIIFSLTSIMANSFNKIMLENNTPQHRIDEFNKSLNLDKPFVIRYINYLGDFIQGDFGVSYINREPLSAILIPKFLETSKLLISSLIISVIIGIPLGIISTIKRITVIGSIIKFFTNLFISIPPTVLSLSLFLLTFRIGNRFSTFTIIVISLLVTSIIVKITRKSVLIQLNQTNSNIPLENLKTNTINLKHILKNTIPLIIKDVKSKLDIIIFILFFTSGLSITTKLSLGIPAMMSSILLLSIIFSILKLVLDIIYAYVKPKEEQIFYTKYQVENLWKKFKTKKGAILGFAIISMFIFVALFANIITDYNDNTIAQKVEERLQEPSSEHWFGTDQLGRDVFARIVHGVKTLLVSTFVATVISATIGGLFGILASYYSNKINSIITKIMDVTMFIPSILLALLILMILGPGIKNMIITITIILIPKYTKLTKSIALSIIEQKYLKEANSNIALKYIFKKSMVPLVAHAIKSSAFIVILIFSLNFMGLVVQPPQPTLGSMIDEARNYSRMASHLLLFPSLVVVLITLSLNLVGDGLEEALSQTS